MMSQPRSATAPLAIFLGNFLLAAMGNGCEGKKDADDAGWVPDGSSVQDASQRDAEDAASSDSTRADGQVEASLADAETGDLPTELVAVDDAVTSLEDQEVLIDVLANDLYPPGASVTIAEIKHLVFGTAVIENNSIRLTPQKDFCGELSFGYVASAMGMTSSAKVTVTVTAVNDPPVARDGSFMLGGKPDVSSVLLVHDADADPLTFAVVSSPSHGSVVVDSNSGAWTYTAGPSFSGSDSFTFKANDGVVDSNVATITIGDCSDPVGTLAPSNLEGRAPLCLGTTDTDLSTSVSLDWYLDAETGAIYDSANHGDSGTGLIREAGEGYRAGIYYKRLPQAGSSHDLGVFMFLSLHVPQGTSVTGLPGAAALVLVAHDQIIVGGTIDVSSPMYNKPGPGGWSGGSTAKHGEGPGGGGQGSVGPSTVDGGGGGGAHGSAGGSGGTDHGGSGGAVHGSMTMVPLEGGSGGGGGYYQLGPGTGGGYGGGGGGALQLAAGGCILLGASATLAADGMEGRSSSSYSGTIDKYGGAGGGGAGGALLLEAPSVTISGTLSAVGGDGGGSNYSSGVGTPGPGSEGSTPGGDGGYGIDSGGGGGGGAGRIRINTGAGTETFAGMLPSQASGLATVGMIATQ